jgi:segregation and condensation protein A
MSDQTVIKLGRLPVDEGYRVKLAIRTGESIEVFEGPLDLLLHLIEKDELDITRVSLALVTDQYLEYIRQAEHINPDNLAEFLVVAAKLLLIKSRALLPKPPLSATEDEEDVGDELARQLIEYKRLKELAEQLRDREAQGLHAYLRVAVIPDLDRKLDLSGVSLGDLLAAARQALSLVPTRPVDGIVKPVGLSVADQIQVITALLARRGSFSFQRMLRKATSRSEVIVTFLAVLELIKRRRVRVEQEKLFGEILVFSVPEALATAAPAGSETVEDAQQ